MNLLYKMLADTDSSSGTPIDDLSDGLTFFQNVWEKLKNWFLSNGGWQFLVRIALTVIIGFLIVKLILSIINKIVARSKLKDQKLAGRFIYNIAKVALLVIYFIAVLTVLGIDTSSLVAVLAASSLAVSLALQSIMTNFATRSSLFLTPIFPAERSSIIRLCPKEGLTLSLPLLTARTSKRLKRF